MLEEVGLRDPCDHNMQATPWQHHQNGWSASLGCGKPSLSYAMRLRKFQVFGKRRSWLAKAVQGRALGQIQCCLVCWACVDIRSPAEPGPGQAAPMDSMLCLHAAAGSSMHTWPHAKLWHVEGFWRIHMLLVGAGLCAQGLQGLG